MLRAVVAHKYVIIGMYFILYNILYSILYSIYCIISYVHDFVLVKTIIDDGMHCLHRHSSKKDTIQLESIRIF